MFRFRAILLVFAVMVGTLAPALAQEAIVEVNKELLTCWIEDIMNKGDMTMSDDVFAADLTVIHQPLGTFDNESYQELVGALHVSFPDLTISDYTVVAVDDYVAAQFVLQGTFSADFLGVPATGETITTQGVIFAQVANGRITQMNLLYDWAGLAQQMGAIPVVETADEGPQPRSGRTYYLD